MLYYEKKDYAKADSTLNISLKLNPANNETRAALNEVNNALQHLQ